MIQRFLSLNRYLNTIDMYLKNNLPVVILKNWEELNSNLEKKLKIWYDDHIHKTSIQNIFPKLTFKYWIND